LHRKFSIFLTNERYFWEMIVTVSLSKALIFLRTIIHIYSSLSNVLNWTSTCGSAQYKRNIQNRTIQSKTVLGLIKYTHPLADHIKYDNPIRFFCRNVFSFWKTISHHNQKTDTTAQLNCTLSTYVTPKTISCQIKKTNTTPQLYCTLSTYICSM
jgi:hypothetical protein